MAIGRRDFLKGLTVAPVAAVALSGVVSTLAPAAPPPPDMTDALECAVNAVGDTRRERLDIYLRMVDHRMIPYSVVVTDLGLI